MEAAMGYLTLSRREGEQIRLTIDSDVDTKVLQHLSDGITINAGEIGQSQVKIRIEPAIDVCVMRNERWEVNARAP